MIFFFMIREDNIALWFENSEFLTQSNSTKLGKSRFVMELVNHNFTTKNTDTKEI
jgi:hypothetical protein